jgi:hypothetical protein
MEISQSFIDSFAPNPGAVAAGQKLVEKGNFVSLKISADGTLLFGECVGSGKAPYSCSVDFLDKAKPVARCSCPSRQFPCKHCVGLVIARMRGANFAQGDVPEDISSKRTKAAKRAEKTDSDRETPKEKAEGSAKKEAARLNAQRKKINAQIEGINTAADLLQNIVRMGLGAIDARLRRSLSEQVKALGNHYIPGVQVAFNNLLLSLEGTEETRFVQAVECLTYLHALLLRGLEYLTRKLENPVPDITTNIEELLGHAWKLEELRDNGCVQADARLLQLSFLSYDDDAAKQAVEEGIWLDMGSGRLYKTRNYRTFRAAKYIKAEDSVFDIVETPNLYIYPGNLNPRVRWDECSFFTPEKADFATAGEFGVYDYTSVVKGVKNQIMSPLADKNPVALLGFKELGMLTQEGGSDPAIQNEAGARIILRNSGYSNTGTTHLLTGALSGARDGALLVVFTHDLLTSELTAMPLALITSDRIIRLLY